jgi:hypothetical protein
MFAPNLGVNYYLTLKTKIMAAVNTFYIEFESIKVIDDGDTWNAGELFCTFKIDNEDIFLISREHPHPVNSGNTLDLTTGYGYGQHPSKTVTRNTDESFSIFGRVGDVDDFLTGADDIAGEFRTTYSGSNGWWPGAKVGDIINVSQRLKSSNMDVIVNYRIKFIERQDDVFLPPPDNRERPVNIADGGAILYQLTNFNMGSESVSLISPSQFFVVGDYNLPVNKHMRTGSGLPGRPQINITLPGIPKKSVKSVRVGTGMMVTLFDKVIGERDLEGSFSTIQDLATLPDGWDQRILSVKVEIYTGHV